MYELTMFMVILFGVVVGLCILDKDVLELVIACARLIKEFIRGLVLIHLEHTRMRKLIKKCRPTKKDIVGGFVTDNNIKVTHYVKPEFLGAFNYKIAVSENLGGYFKGNHYAIVTDTRFDELSKETKEYVLYHELGHIQSGHIPSIYDITNKIHKRIDAVKFLYDINDKKKQHCEEFMLQELKANAHALSYFGKNKSLECLKELFHKEPNILTAKHILLLEDNKEVLQWIKDWIHKH